MLNDERIFRFSRFHLHERYLQCCDHYILPLGWCSTNRETMNVQKGSEPPFPFSIDVCLNIKDLFSFAVNFFHSITAQLSNYCWTSGLSSSFSQSNVQFALLLLLKTNSKVERNQSKDAPRIMCIVDCSSGKKNNVRTVDTNISKKWLIIIEQVEKR